jgi:hypothetical protein
VNFFWSSVVNWLSTMDGMNTISKTVALHISFLQYNIIIQLFCMKVGNKKPSYARIKFYTQN